MCAGSPQHTSADVKHPGTFEGLRDKIPYLKELGVNCVELMPIFEFNEAGEHPHQPAHRRAALQLLGLQHGRISSRRRAASPPRACTARELQEFKQLVKALHEANIEVILDVVFNHTAEGGPDGPTVSFRGIDNKTYYITRQPRALCELHRLRKYRELQPPRGARLRDRLPALLGGGVSHRRLPLRPRLGARPRLDRRSAGQPAAPRGPRLRPRARPLRPHRRGLGRGRAVSGRATSRPTGAGWNGTASTATAARRFLKGDTGVAGEMVAAHHGLARPLRRRRAQADRVDQFHHLPRRLHPARPRLRTTRSTTSPTARTNNDGANDNWSWNCGEEGETENPQVNALRLKQQKNALALLLVSQGVPMLYMGDECGAHTGRQQQRLLPGRGLELVRLVTSRRRTTSLLRFAKGMIAFRKANPAPAPAGVSHQPRHRGQRLPGHLVAWHPAVEAGLGVSSRTLAFMLCGRHGAAAGGQPHFIYCIFNMYYKPWTSPSRCSLRVWNGADTWTPRSRARRIFAKSARKSGWDRFSEPSFQSARRSFFWASD